MSREAFAVQRVVDRKSGQAVVCRSYKELDRVIKANAKATYAFALALYEMRESRAYKAKYGTFEDYCQRELGHPRSWANRQIEAQDFGSLDDPKAGLFSTGESEWPTPPHVISAAVRTLGAIDLDPCASAAGRVPATTCYTIEDDGLSQSWAGRVYMNPPYGRVIGRWVEKLTGEFTAGNVTAFVALVPARTDTAWWQNLAGCHLCLVRGRLTFGDAEAGAPFPSAAAYAGPDPAAFIAAFAELGPVWKMVAP
jgi:phage N-6-adenine-methyltransferase